MKQNKYDEIQIERDYKYYKNRDNSSDSSIYFMLVERYRMRMQIAENKLKESLKDEVIKGDDK